MAVADLQRGFDRLYADVTLQGHGAKTDLRNTAAVGVNKLHHNLLERGVVMGGAAECPVSGVLPTGPARRQH
jgi:hypothetical protein